MCLIQVGLTEPTPILNVKDIILLDTAMDAILSDGSFETIYAQCYVLFHVYVFSVAEFKFKSFGEHFAYSGI